MLRTQISLQNQCTLTSDSDTESDDLSKYFSALVPPRYTKGKGVEEETSSQSAMGWKEDLESLVRRAEMYQDYMKEIEIPGNRGSVIPFNTWQELAKSMKQLYKQPLHYLTNVQMKQWDKARLDTEQEQVPMDHFVHPAKAEATVWLIEEIHRQNTSHLFLAKIWSNEPLNYHAFVDPFYQY
ncbi:hypothetical protein RHSIM_Rhsim03G0003800 [Rhododendron simsii]|uniref:Protein RDM1 n=1 Tax=Rhododendron simsii TaxID=118357 RepID=A0A834H8H2_RHOSS|nr:hypothetical protein RHSIM_Rhsim03G0003800 [Rhododendron simsii]